MLENVRESLRALLAAARSPADRRAVLADMKSTLVRARLGVDDARAGLAESRRRLEVERRELETVRRRRDLATRIGDTETVAIADRFERQHGDHAEVLAQKVAVQERELELLEREVAALGEDFRRALAGIDPTTGASPSAGGAERMGSGGLHDADVGAARGHAPADPLDDASEVDEELARLARERARASREAEAAARLDALKKRMGR